MMNKYVVVWLRMASASVQAALTHRIGGGLFLLGKLLRFILFILFLMVIYQRMQSLAGYSFEQILTFFLVFNLLDLFGQIFFRGIYWFRNQVISGDLDFILVQPMNALFRVLTQHTDILDLPLLIIVVVMLWMQPLDLSVISGLMFLSGVIIITAIHIAVAALGVMTTEVDHTIMIYRDISQMARFPIDIYADWIRAVLTFAIPVAVAFTFPAKAMLGLMSWQGVVGSMTVAVVSFGLAVKLWQYSLKQYASASS